MARLESIRDMGYAVNFIWECELRRMKASDPDLRYYLENNCFMMRPLDPRNAVFGGRTNCIQIFAEVENAVVEFTLST